MDQKSKQLKALQTELAKFLANNYALYLKTQNFHWNVLGNNFLSLHNFFQQQYENLAEAIDDLAERLRALDAIAPGSFKEFVKLSSIKDSIGKKSSKKMLETLLKDHIFMQKFIKQILVMLNNLDDYASQDLLTGRLYFHEKTIWILKSLISK